MGGLKWKRRSLVRIAEVLNEAEIHITANTVGRLLRALDYSLHVNRKEVSPGSPPERDAQFQYLFELWENFADDGRPVVSVDTKKKELVGNFANRGAAWGRQARRVNDHDFRSLAKGIAIPWGVYDTEANRGAVFVGTSHDTSNFAVDCLAKWWQYDGRRRYPQADELLVLADGGGSNGSRRRAWKHGLQQKLCDRQGLAVTVSHYPPGASKWNPIEHRLFGEISKNWAGIPLDSYETILNYIATTRTEAGLTVKAYLVTKHYPTKVKVSDQQMAQLALERHETLPQWNYTIRPR